MSHIERLLLWVKEGRPELLDRLIVELVVRWQTTGRGW